MIKLLEKNIADKIAAGEVIERPVSIIKELVENAIDAGSTEIIIEIKKGGKEYIRVSDNGTGIEKDEVEIAFLRHATSKISTVSDINNIHTLGFRGEALASIAAVTRTEMITKTASDIEGMRIVIHGGEILSKQVIGAPQGTTIIVNDLFYNVPARSKFMKSDAGEASLIIDFVSRISLTRTDIKFRLINNSNVVFSTQGKGNLLHTILSVYKDREYSTLVEINRIENGIKVYGYVSKPALSRANKRSQYCFVNGRVIKSSVIDRGIELGYRERLFEGRHPVTFIFVDLNPKEIDVNIHPNKKEVKFHDELSVSTCISNAILSALQTKESIPDISDTFDISEDDFKYTKTAIASETPSKTRQEQQVDIKNFLSSKRSDEEELYRETNDDEESNSYEFEQKDEYHNTLEAQGKDKSIVIDNPNSIPFDFESLRLGDIIFGTYITAVDDKNFYLIDQHAAHERVNYEKFVESYNSSKKTSQILLVPFTVDIPKEIADTESVDYWQELLLKMGFNIEKFGDNTYIVREIPQFVEMGEAKHFLELFTDYYVDGINLHNKVVVDKLISKSCKSSIKAHDMISPAEAEALLNQLKRCRNPFSCPHGRPTFVRFSLYEIERMFKRIV